MTQIENPNETVSETSKVLETVSIPNVSSISSHKQVTKRKVKFHAYDISKNCRDFGKEHKYVNRGTYLKCTRCGSSRTLKMAK